MPGSLTSLLGVWRSFRSGPVAATTPRALSGFPSLLRPRCLLVSFVLGRGDAEGSTGSSWGPRRQRAAP